MGFAPLRRRSTASCTIVCVTGGRAAGQTIADAHDAIRVVGARENNLRGVDVVIPKRRLTVLTGVPGSGKSSLVFTTIAAELHRLINETYPAFVQGFMDSSARLNADRLEGLTPTIVVDHERTGSNPRSTLGTVSDIGALLRVLYSGHGVWNGRSSSERARSATEPGWPTPHAPASSTADPLLMPVPCRSLIWRNRASSTATSPPWTTW